MKKEQFLPFNIYHIILCNSLAGIYMYKTKEG